MKYTKIITAAILALALAACSDKATAEVSDLPDVTTSSTALTEDTTTAEETAAAAEITTVSETKSEETAAAQEEATTVSETEAVISVDYKKDYAEYLSGVEFYGGGGLYIGDINGDNIPEAVIETNSMDNSIILYYNEDGMQEFFLESVSHSFVRYVPDENMIVYYMWYRGGFADIYVYQWTGNTYEVVYTISGGMALFGEDMSWSTVCTETEGTINGEEVAPEEFEEAYKKFDKLLEDYEYFPVVNLGDENFENYVKENLPDFDNWDIFKNNY